VASSVADPQAYRLVRAFAQVGDPDLRSLIVSFVRGVAAPHRRGRRPARRMGCAERNPSIARSGTTRASSSNQMMGFA